MIMGTVKFYSDKMGLGLIRPDDGSKDVPINAMVLERSGMRNLAEGQKVFYEMANDRKFGGLAVSDIETV